MPVTPGPPAPAVTALNNASAFCRDMHCSCLLFFRDCSWLVGFSILALPPSMPQCSHRLKTEAIKSSDFVRNADSKTEHFSLIHMTVARMME